MAEASALEEQQAKPKKEWHDKLGRMFEDLFFEGHTDITSDFAIASKPSRGDLLFRKRSGPLWSEYERSCLPDGLRDSIALYVLAEYKHSQSLNRIAIEQTLECDIAFRRRQGHTREEVESFLILPKIRKIGGF